MVVVDVEDGDARFMAPGFQPLDCRGDGQCRSHQLVGIFELPVTDHVDDQERAVYPAQSPTIPVPVRRLGLVVERLLLLSGRTAASSPLRIAAPGGRKPAAQA